MKIGFSFGRCIRDIVLGKVALSDVLVIITQTDIRRDNLPRMVETYCKRQEYLQGLAPDECLTVAYELWDCGKIHQPRGFCPAIGLSGPAAVVWMDAFPTTATDNPTVKTAWENYQMALKLAE